MSLFYSFFYYYYIKENTCSSMTSPNKLLVRKRSFPLYTRTHTHTRRHAHTHILVQSRMHTHTQISTGSHSHTRARTQTHAHTYIHIHIHIRDAHGVMVRVVRNWHGQWSRFNSQTRLLEFHRAPMHLGKVCSQFLLPSNL